MIKGNHMNLSFGFSKPEILCFGGILKRDYLACYREREIAIAYQLGEITLYEKPKKLRDLGLDYVPQSFAYI